MTTENEISIFENLYLFNWKTGETWHFPSEIKDIIQKLRYLNFDITINQLVWFTTLPGFSDYCDLVLQGKALHQHEVAKIIPAISINASDKNTLDFELSFIDDNKKLYSPPELFNTLVFEDGLLGSFKKKKDAYSFILHLNDIFRGENNISFRFNTFDRLRRDWPIYLQYLLTPGVHYQFDNFNQCFIQIEKDLLIDLFKSLIDAFGDSIFRFSSYQKEQLKLIYNIQTGVAFQNLRSFIEKVQLRGISVYFDRREIGQWHSRVRFERRSSTTKWFELDVTLNAEDYAILKNVDKQTGMAMSDAGLILLNSDQLNLAKMLSRVLETTKKEELADRSLREYRFSIPYNRARIIEIFELKKIGIAGLLTEEEENLCHKLLNLKEMPTYDVPEMLAHVLRPYQRVGYNWLRFLYEHRLGACLADDMGLGKTIQVIALLKSIEASLKRVLIVCPVTILINWQKEFEKFSDLKTLIYHGGQRQLPADIKFVITSYGVMKKEADTTFKDVRFDIFILDEVQHLKNMRSLGAWSARKISADFRICLTGTPVENDFAEFYNIIDLAIPGIWGDLQIIRTISNDITRERARTTAGPFILRRTKGQVLTDLPAKIENNVYLQFSEEERAAYLHGLLEIKGRIESAASKRKYGEILRGLLRLRQSCLWQGKQLQPGQVPKNL
ncbi:MAG: SNF2-related protein, partial [Bdellovibrionota bacterium]